MNVIQGQSKPVRFHLTGKISRNKIDLTGVTFMEACFPAALAGSSVDLYYETNKGDTAVASDLISNIPNDSHIQEGMLVTGTGIPANTKVIKTQRSATTPTAAGVVQLSNNATALGTQVSFLFQNIYIDGPATDGVIIAQTEPQHTSLMKAATNQTIEITYILADGLTHKTQLLNVLNVVKSIC